MLSDKLHLNFCSFTRQGLSVSLSSPAKFQDRWRSAKNSVKSHHSGVGNLARRSIGAVPLTTPDAISEKPCRRTRVFQFFDGAICKTSTTLPSGSSKWLEFAC